MLERSSSRTRTRTNKGVVGDPIPIYPTIHNLQTSSPIQICPSYSAILHSCILHLLSILISYMGCNLTFRLRYRIDSQGGGFFDRDDDDDFRTAKQEASQRAGSSGNSELFHSIISSIGQKQGKLADEDIDEQGKCCALHHPRRTANSACQTPSTSTRSPTSTRMRTKKTRRAWALRRPCTP